MSELEEINTQIIAYLEQGQPPVHLIVNDADVNKMPISIRELRGQFTFIHHPNIGLMIAIGKVNALLKYIVPMVAKIARINLIRRNTMADALDYIKNHDATIDWQEADDGVFLV